MHYYQQRATAQSKGKACYVTSLPELEITVFQQSKPPTRGRQRAIVPFLKPLGQGAKFSSHLSQS